MSVGAEVASRRMNGGNVLLEAIPHLPPVIGERLRPYQDIRSATFSDWDRTGRAMYVLTRAGSVDQLHRVEGPGSPPDPITRGDEPVLQAERRPGSEDLLLRADRGGSEFWQLFLFQPGRGPPRLLTDGMSRNQAPRWSRDGRWLAYTSTRRNGRASDVWIRDLARDSEAIMLEAEAGVQWAPADWSPDGSLLLLTEYRSVTDSRLHLLDLASGRVRRLLPPAEDRCSVTGVVPRFVEGGDAVLLATDAGGAEFRRLGVLRLRAGGIDPITDHLPWDVELLDLTRDDAVAAFVTNEDGYGRLRLLDLAGGRIDEPEGLPDGVVRSVGFSPDGRRLAVSLSGPRLPGDVFVIDTGSGGGPPQRWTVSDPTSLRLDRFPIPRPIRYPTFDRADGRSRRIPALVYRPDGPGPHPVVVQIHGGPESQSRPEFVAPYEAWVRELGVALVRPNVRGSSGYGRSYLGLDDGLLREDSVRDIGALLDWIEREDDLDADRVAVFGGSYGGYMVLASLVHFGDRLRAGVDVVGISNFVTFLEGTQEYRRALRRAEYGDEQEPSMRAFLMSISPARHAHRIRTPLLVAQGANDPRVPTRESRQIVEAVRKTGGEVWYVEAGNEGHGFRRRENRDLFHQVVHAFLERHL